MGQNEITLGVAENDLAYLYTSAIIVAYYEVSWRWKEGKRWM